MGSIREVSKKDGTTSYHAEVRVRGSVPQRASFRTRTLAKKWVQDIESSIRDGRHFRTSESKKHTVGELVDRFIEQWIPKSPKYQKKNTALVLWWKEELGHLILADLTPSQIAASRDKLLGGVTYRKSQRSGGTVNRYLAAFSKALGIAVKEWGWIQENPMDKISKPQEGKGRERFLSEDEIKRLLLACRNSSNPYLFTVVRIALATGMRHGEIINLKWEDIDFSSRTITLHETKNGDRRIIPLTNEVEEALKASPNFGRLSKECIFKAIYNREGAEVAKIRYAFEAALKQAAIEKFRFHDLRHTAASYMAMMGATQGELMAILGHRSPHMTRRYAHYSQQHIANLMERTQRKFIEEEQDAE